MPCPGPDSDAAYNNRKVSDTGTPAGKNRLCGETSPYLLQHADNPVDWHPWDDEALTIARRENKPIFLSIGYAACHWCHVMERESFENETIATFMNAHFVNIKVDREERPDLDEIYMNAVNAMTGGGGWPLSVFLTPDLKPFYGGTYFPPYGLYGMPSFLDVLQQIVSIWHQEPSRAQSTAEQLTARLRMQVESRSSRADFPVDELRAVAATQLESSYVEHWGGWGKAPKFPSPASISFLLRHYKRTGRRPLLDMAVSTLKQMAFGGLHDHLGGGFHRYSTDEKWRVPHFEKMLYDNAQLVVSYLEGWQVTHDPFFKSVACDTLAYVLRDMRGEYGAFYSSEDADSEGEEGRYYLWTRQDIINSLGEEDGNEFCRVYSVLEEGNFTSRETYHQGQNILFRKASENDCSEESEARYAVLREKLLEVRCNRVSPAVDDKIITAWNGLMISALAKAALTWDISQFKDAACKAGWFLKETLLKEDVLYRTWRSGTVRYPGYLDDYAVAANAYIDLYECTAEIHWLETATRLVEIIKNRFTDQAGEGFYSTEASHANLLLRVRPLHDTAEPSGNAMAAMALARLGHYLNLADYLSLAESSLSQAASIADRAPLGFLNTILVADYIVESPVEIVFCGQPESKEVRAWKHALAQQFIPCRIIAYNDGQNVPLQHSLFEAKVMVEGKPTVYVCQNRRCLPPVNTREAFERLLSGLK